ncbi:unnamed protein product [Rhizophagus irregularis]|nr:unnamed protein product [Rhizophagus irregularis]
MPELTTSVQIVNPTSALKEVNKKTMDTPVGILRNGNVNSAQQSKTVTTVTTKDEKIGNSDKNMKLLKILDMNDIHAVAEVKLKNKQNVFGIVTHKRTYYVQAASKKNLDEWVEAINNVKKVVQEREFLDDDDTGSQADSEDMRHHHTRQFQINASPPSSPITGQFASERKDSSPTASSEEKRKMMMRRLMKGWMMAQFHKGLVYKLDRYKKFGRKGGCAGRMINFYITRIIRTRILNLIENQSCGYSWSLLNQIQFLNQTKIVSKLSPPKRTYIVVLMTKNLRLHG